MDHEFGTSALGSQRVGWNWFSAQLDNRTELMVYEYRRTDGAVDPFSSGMLIAADGTTRPLAGGDFKVTATGQWRSPRTGGVYPSGWVLDVPSAALKLTIKPYLADQENVLSYAYWEGAVMIEGMAAGAPVKGNGYAELTGYAKSLAGQF
jgi:predicted secreted hydrolase